MSVGPETRGQFEYSVSVYRTAWDVENMPGIYFTCTVADAGSRTEAQMDEIAQDIRDRLAASGFDTVVVTKNTKVFAEITADIPPAP